MESTIHPSRVSQATFPVLGQVDHRRQPSVVAHPVPVRQQHWVQAGTDRQGQVGSSPCPAASFPAGTGRGMWGWRSGIVLDSGWEVRCCMGSTGSHSTTLGIVLWETIVYASLCCSNQVKSKVYSWKSQIKRSPKLIVVVLGKKKTVQKPLQMLE